VAGLTAHRGGITLPEECWAWLRETAHRDGSTRDDLLEGLVLLAMDADGLEFDEEKGQAIVSTYLIEQMTSSSPPSAADLLAALKRAVK
jgi:hypothetical protein